VIAPRCHPPGDAGVRPRRIETLACVCDGASGGARRLSSPPGPSILAPVWARENAIIEHSRCPILKSDKKIHRIYIVDDHPLVSEGLSVVLNAQPDLRVVGTCATVAEASRSLLGAEIDCLVLDLSLRDGSGFDLLEWVRRSGSAIRTLVLSMHSDAAVIRKAMQLGARGYLLKHEASDLVVTAVRAVLADGIYLSPEARRSHCDTETQTAQPLPDVVMQALSDRERELFALLADGLMTAEIAHQLGISNKTVESHKENIKRKLGLKSASALVALASKTLRRPPL